ncbi:hypothetical protein, partial [Roseomonas sp. USHLN139]|uniref:hypothetical protein n=1 Tax=Roseomonas sp. USHLN139 TaxID=3081298 RepID=UPI003FA722A7
MLHTQVSFQIQTADDAVRATRIMAAIQAEYDGPEADVVDTALPPAVMPETVKPRQQRQSRRSAPVDPVEAYNAKAAEQNVAPIEPQSDPALVQADQPTVQSDPAPQSDQPAQQSDPTPPQADQAAAPSDQPAPPANRDEQLAAVRAMAKAKGAAWL